ncbi:MAG: hypothetical protein ACREDK_09245 [Thermoplasmata archaeon]
MPGPPSFGTMRVPRFDVVELTSLVRDPDEEALPTPHASVRSVQSALWNASIREVDRLAVASSRFIVPYVAHDLVRIPREDTELRLWTTAYPKGSKPRARRKGPAVRLRIPNLADERRWRTITMGEFHRQRRFYGLVQVEGRVQCVRTLDDRRMLRIPLSNLRTVAPLFRRMIDPPWFAASAKTAEGTTTETEAPSARTRA